MKSGAPTYTSMSTVRRTLLILFVSSAAAFLGSTRGSAQDALPVEYHAVAAGSRVVFAALAQGSNPFTYQWRKNGADLTGEVGLLLVLQDVGPGDSGGYSVVVSNSSGSAASEEVMLAVLLADAPTIVQQPYSQTVNSGKTAVFQTFVSSSFPVTYAWLRNGEALHGQTNSLLVLGDVETSDAGSYSVVVMNVAGSVTSVPATLEVVPAMEQIPSSQISHFAARAALAAGQTLVVGVVMNDGPGKLLVRAAGPALNDFGVSPAMADPRIELHGAGASVFSNDDWPSALANTFAAAGAFAFREGSKDAALVQDVNGESLLHVRGTGPGVVVAEVYPLDQADAPGVRNFSVRHGLRAGDDVLLIGFTLTGDVPKPLLMRAVGPGLGAFEVRDALTNPKLEIYNTAGALVGENDNWDAGLAPLFAEVGAFVLPAESRDAAVLVPLVPGGYTVLVRSADGRGGETMLEVYEVR
jgi:hypothetical protein